MNKTFAMIKPDAVSAKHVGDIISLIELNGFSILRLQKRTLSKDEAQIFYGVHLGKSFFEELIMYIISGPVILLALEKDLAISDWRQLIGATNPINATVGTIRKMYAESVGRNAVHGSDSEENAKIELDFFFKDLFI
jgi:nucleoside-diphosphate kinase